jgi:hypothetical protein
MDAEQWMLQFKQVHEQARKSGTSEKHRAMKDELARSLVQAQGLTVPDGQTHRRAFRIAQAWQVELNNAYKCLTRDVSGGGFSALVPTHFNVGEKVTFSMRIGPEPVTGSATVVAAIKQAGNSRISFTIASMPTSDAERFEDALFDCVLSRYVK